MDADRPLPTPGAQALEDEVARARARHRERLAALTRIADRAASRPTGPPPPKSALEQIRAGFRRLFGAGPAERPPSLEDEVEAAQRRVSEIAHALDHLAADRSEVHREVERLTERIAAARARVDAAVAEVDALEAEIAAALEADPADPRIPALEARLTTREGDRRDHARAVQRLGAIQHLHAEHLAAVAGFERGLTALHEAGTEVLDALDGELAGLAAEERARQLASAVSGDLARLRDRVARVNRLTTEGAVLLTEHLDRLADEVDLLAPADAAALAAEQELSVFLRDRTAAEAVARARQQAALRRARDG